MRSKCVISSTINAADKAFSPNQPGGSARWICCLGVRGRAGGHIDENLAGRPRSGNPVLAEHDFFQRCAVADAGDDERARPREFFRAAGFGRTGLHKRGEFRAIPIPVSDIKIFSPL